MSRDNFFNEDEFGLSNQFLSYKTLHLKGEKCCRGSIANCVSPDWMLEMLMERDFIKKYKIFKDVKSSPSQY